MLRVRSLCARVFRSFLELSAPAKALAFRFPSRTPVAARQNMNSNRSATAHLHYRPTFPD
jgi:hypothetical protein